MATESQDIKWSASVDGENIRHKRIRRVSVDQFYTIVPGDTFIFYKMCMALPFVIEHAIGKGKVNPPCDTVMQELQQEADKKKIPTAMAAYLLGFSTYAGFSSL